MHDICHFFHAVANFELSCYSLPLMDIMQKEIHPKYHDGVTVTCSCGNTFKVGSTKESIKIEICSACHPFYTGNEKIVDTAGRVERFKARAAKQDKSGKVSAKKTKSTQDAEPVKG